MKRACGAACKPFLRTKPSIRTSLAAAELLGQQAIVFPSHHGGFLGGDFGYPGQPEAFARKLRNVIGDEN